MLMFSSSLDVSSVADSTKTNESDLIWNSITFGQSTDLNFSANVLPDKIGTNYAKPDEPGTINGNIILESRGGKLAQGHDGLTFYYTTLDPNEHNFVLEADVVINQFGPETDASPGSQDSAGIMVRDVNGGARQEPMMLGYEEVPAASNIFGVGMMRHGISPIYRMGVEYPWGNLGSQLNAGAFPSVPELPIGTPVRLKLERTDTEFIMSAIFTHLGEEQTFEKRVEGADAVQIIDPDQMQVGFYASRNAKITVSNANLSLSKANTVPTPPIETEPDKASMNIVSSSYSGTDNYELKVHTNYDGVISILKDQEEIVTESKVQANKVFSHLTNLDKEGTDFIVKYLPHNAPTDELIKKNKTVTKKIFNEGEGLFVSPNGENSAQGTKDDPLDIQTAINYVLPGETIYLLGGTYTPSSSIEIRKENSGIEGALKRIVPFNGEEVVFDGQQKVSNIFRLNSDYWHIAGFEITQSAGNAMRVNGSNNVIDMMTFSYNGNTGFQITGSGSDPELWPQNNLILNSESHDNRDPSNIDADGFAAKLGVGSGNVFRGNIAHHNIDDGWDLYNRTNEGANMPVLLENNISYSNGKLSDGYNEDGTSGSGFKVGGEGLPVAHILKNNISFDNNMDGFTDNFNPGKLVVESNISFDNKRFNFIFRSNPYFEKEEQGIFKGNVSIRTDDTGTNEDFISGNVDETNFFYNGEETVNTLGEKYTGNVIELVNNIFDYDDLGNIISVKRESDGNIDWGDIWSTKIDVQELDELIGIAEETLLSSSEDYTIDSLDQLEQAIKFAKKAVQQITTEKELQQEVEKLTEAIRLLEIIEDPKVSLTRLEELIIEAKAISNKDNQYTDESYTMLQEVIKHTEQLLETINSEEMLEQVISDLEATMNSLVKIPSLPEETDNGEVDDKETDQKDEHDKDVIVDKEKATDDETNNKIEVVEGEGLPKTATSNYTMLLVGSILFIIAISIFVFRKKAIARK